MFVVEVLFIYLLMLLKWMNVEDGWVWLGIVGRNVYGIFVFGVWGVFVVVFVILEYE